MLSHLFLKWLRTVGAYWIGVNDLVANLPKKKKKKWPELKVSMKIWKIWLHDGKSTYLYKKL
jgi:hypothetical protein